MGFSLLKQQRNEFLPKKKKNIEEYGPEFEVKLIVFEIKILFVQTLFNISNLDFWKINVVIYL